jgi:hypothetical protein
MAVSDGYGSSRGATGLREPLLEVTAIVVSEHELASRAFLGGGAVCRRLLGAGFHRRGW